MSNLKLLKNVDSSFRLCHIMLLRLLFSIRSLELMAFKKKIDNRIMIGIKHSLFPIPQREINANTALVQHPEWQ